MMVHTEFPFIMRRHKVCVIRDSSSSKTKQNLHRDLSYILVMSQCFGVFPLCGICGEFPNNLRFSWRAKRVCYAIALILATSFLVFMSLFRICYGDIDLNKTTNCVFFLNGLLVSTLFLSLSRRWPKFMSVWNDIETSINNSGCATRLSRKFFAITIMIMGIAFVEHLLFIAKSYTNATLIVENGSSQDVWRHIFTHDDPFIFEYIPYSLYLGIFIKVINFVNTFYWNFSDVFIMLVSLALAAKFKQVTVRIKRANNLKISCGDFWKHIRLDYDKLCRLCWRLDDEISTIILVSFANNLYFILMQFYGSLIPRNTLIESVYFFFSFFLLLLRTMSVSLFAARVNDASKEALPYLNSICSEHYNEEIDRLVSQISTNTVALSGKKLFHVTRGLIFSIAGTIVTYELFLLQFSINLKI